MLANVLATLDGSEHSETILPVVIKLATGTETAVTLFSTGQPPASSVRSEVRRDHPTVPETDDSGVVTVPPPADPFRYDESRGQAIERRERELEEYLTEKAILLSARDIKVRVAVTIGEDPAKEIIEFATADDHSTDLIVMATHGRSGLGRLIFGSVASTVLASGVRPVLLVRPSGIGPQAG